MVYGDGNRIARGWADSAEILVRVEIVTRPIRSLRRNVNKLYENHPHSVHLGHSLVHGAYFAFAFMEGHGLYSYAAGLLAVGTVVAMVKGHEDDEDV